jgi:hypothetical protein
LPLTELIKGGGATRSAASPVRWRCQCWATSQLLPARREATDPPRRPRRADVDIDVSVYNGPVPSREPIQSPARAAAGAPCRWVVLTNDDRRQTGDGDDPAEPDTAVFI